ncbi:MAG: LysM peptidoglycan-binding domain-containing protein [Rhizobiaceae bacterium]
MTEPTLDIQQPQPFDIVGQDVLIAGNAAGFEATLSVSIADGHDEVKSFVTVGSFAVRQFQGTVTIPDDIAFKLSRLFLRIADDTGNENGPSVTIPILYGPLILDGYTGWQPYTVQPGDTLTKIAQEQYGNSNFAPIVAANQQIITDPNLIFVGQFLRIPRNDT